MFYTNGSYQGDLHVSVTDGFPEECFLPINPTNCTGPAPDPPHYFFAATENYGDYDYGCHKMAAGQCNENGNSFVSEAECKSRCQGLNHLISLIYFRRLSLDFLIHHGSVCLHAFSPTSVDPVLVLLLPAKKVTVR